MKKKWWIGSAATLAFGSVAAGLWWPGVGLLVGGMPQAGAAVSGVTGKSGGAKKATPPLEFSPAEVVQPSMAAMTQVVEFSGALVAPNSAVVRAKTSGTLMSLSVSEGSRVVAGQSIGRVDTADLSSRMAERQAVLESARAALTQAQRTHANNERLAAQSFISPSALEASQAQLDTARAQVGQAAASLETMRLALRDANVVAPIAGIVSKRHVLPGEKVVAEQPIVGIVDLRRLELAGTVGTHEVGKLSTGVPVQVRVEGQESAPVAGRIARIAPAAEPGTRSIGVTVQLDNPKETYRAGQYAMAQVSLTDPRQRLTVPLAAVSSASGQDHVWTIEGGVLTRRAVTLGRRDERGARVEVLQGIGAGQQLLAARFDNLREGAPALVTAAQASPVASASASLPVLK